MAHLDPVEVFAKTIFFEARGEPREAQEWVGWVIKNRAADTTHGWPDNVKDVCLQPGEFDAWVNKTDIKIDNWAVYNMVRAWAATLLEEPAANDPTGGCDHYCNPALAKGSRKPKWLDSGKVEVVRDIGRLKFFKSKQ